MYLDRRCARYDVCPSAARGWLAGRHLVEMGIRIIDISFLHVEQNHGNGSQAPVAELAAGWPLDNQEAVDGWVTEALAATS